MQVLYDQIHRKQKDTTQPEGTLKKKQIINTNVFLPHEARQPRKFGFSLLHGLLRKYIYLCIGILIFDTVDDYSRTGCGLKTDRV